MLTGVFCIYCMDDTMSPWREAGALVHVTRARPPQTGSHVVVILDTGEQGDRAMLKRLIGRTADEWELAQHNPPGRIIVPASKVKEILRVLEWEEVAGFGGPGA